MPGAALLTDLTANLITALKADNGTDAKAQITSPNVMNAARMLKDGRAMLVSMTLLPWMALGSQ